MILFNRNIADFKIGMTAIIGKKELKVTANTGERVCFGKKQVNWLNLEKVGLLYN